MWDEWAEYQNSKIWWKSDNLDLKVLIYIYFLFNVLAVFRTARCKLKLFCLNSILFTYLTLWFYFFILCTFWIAGFVISETFGGILLLKLNDFGDLSYLEKPALAILQRNYDWSGLMLTTNHVKKWYSKIVMVIFLLDSHVIVFVTINVHYIYTWRTIPVVI